MIEYSKQAEKFILSQGRSQALRIFKAIDKLPLGDIKRLKGRNSPQLYRLRIGDYRAVFCIDEDKIKILKVDNRGDIY